MTFSIPFPAMRLTSGMVSTTDCVELKNAVSIRKHLVQRHSTVNEDGVMVDVVEEEAGVEEAVVAAVVVEAIAAEAPVDKTIDGKKIRAIDSVDQRSRRPKRRGYYTGNGLG